jgi:uncharacterized protein
MNDLCAGYKAFFTHIDQPLKSMAGLIEQDRYAVEIIRTPNLT